MKKGEFSKQESEVLTSINLEELIRITRELIRVKSVNPPGNYNKISEYISKELNHAGFEVQLFEKIRGKTNVFGFLNGQNKHNTLLLSGHMDVVEAKGKDWVYDPFKAEFQDGYIWGRGAVDMKAAIAAMIVAGKTVASMCKLKGSLMIGATVDDEIAGPLGMKYAINEAIPKIGWPVPNFHVLGEPNNLNITIAFKGRMWIKLSSQGKSAHGGLPEFGVNAIDKMITLLQEIKTMPQTEHPLMGKDTMNIGTILGGDQVNIVPSYCESTIDYRFCSPVGSDEAKLRITQAIERVTIKKYNSYAIDIFECREPVEQDIQSQSIGMAIDCIKEVTKRDCKLLGALSAGDAYYSLRNGIPACWIGPGDPTLMHSINEKIKIDDLLMASKIYALFIMRYCGLC